MPLRNAQNASVIGGPGGVLVPLAWKEYELRLACSAAGGSYCQGGADVTMKWTSNRTAHAHTLTGILVGAHVRVKCAWKAPHVCIVYMCVHVIVVLWALCSQSLCFPAACCDSLEFVCDSTAVTGWVAAELQKLLHSFCESNSEYCFLVSPLRLSFAH